MVRIIIRLEPPSNAGPLTAVCWCVLGGRGGRLVSSWFVFGGRGGGASLPFWCSSLPSSNLNDRRVSPSEKCCRGIGGGRSSMSLHGGEIVVVC